jgi:glycosyltransferase involved in cell wall biosynthesis
VTDVAPSPVLSFVLPAYNEVGLLGSTITNLVTGLDARDVPYEILIVENGSSDGTLRLARLLAAQLDNVRVLSLPRGNYGGALVAGFRAAKGDIVVNFDVDYYDLGFLDTAATLLGSPGCSLVVASKRCAGADDRRPLARRVLTMAFTAALRELVGMPVSDAHGMKAFRRVDVVPLIESCRMRGSIFDVELVVRTGRAGLGLTEVPATVVERRPCRTPVWRRTVEGALGILRLRAILAAERSERSARGSATRTAAGPAHHAVAQRRAP